MTWTIQQSIAHGPGGDRYVYGIVTIKDNREVARYFNLGDAERVLILMNRAYRKGHQESRRHYPALFVLSAALVSLILFNAYKQFQ